MGLVMNIIRYDNPRRIWELDFFRGIALLLMIFFHLIFDLADIYGYKINYESGTYHYIGRTAVILFIIISGISSTLSKNNIKRGTEIFAFALLITLVTHFAGQGLEVKFGILHFMGISMIIYPLLAKIKSPYLTVLGVIIVVLGNYFSHITTTKDYFFILNLTSSSFYSSDYYPLLPWIGLYILGILLGRHVYREKKSIFQWRMKDNLVMMAGRNTLLVYLLHQPVLLALLFIIFKIF